MTYSQPFAQNGSTDYDQSSFYRVISLIILYLSLSLIWAICKHNFDPITFFGLKYIPYWWVALFAIPLVINFFIYMGFVNSYIGDDFLSKSGWYTVILFGVTLPFTLLWFITLLLFKIGVSDFLLFNDIGGSFLVLLLTLSLPFNNIWSLSKTLRDDYSNPILIGLVNGTALSTAAIYTILILPILSKTIGSISYMMNGSFMGHIALFTCIITLTIPAGSLFLAILISSQLWEQRNNYFGKTISRTTNLTILACLFLILAPGLQSLLVSVEANKAIIGSPTGANSRKLLSLFNCENEVLRRCYWQGEFRFQLLPIIYSVYSENYSLSALPNSTNARKLFYKLTGHTFNEYHRPSKDASLFWMNMFDTAQGSEIIGGKLDSLSLVSSKIDCYVEDNSLCSRYNWTMQFNNDSKLPVEARCQILLPPDGIVTDMKLWINGKSKAATITGRKLARKTYERIVKRRRDPALVTSRGKDKVMLQCYPVPANGNLKLALQFGAPLSIKDKNSAYLSMPYLIETNFKIAKHNVNLISTENKGKSNSHIVKAEEHSNSNLPNVFYKVSLNKEGNFGLCKDYLSKQKESIEQSIGAQNNRLAKHIVFVIDGSATTSKFVNQIEDTLANLPDETKASIVFASDIAKKSIVQSNSNKNLATKFKRYLPDLVGGVDNSPYLMKGLRFAKENQSSYLVWIHGPQPVVINKNDIDEVIDFLKTTDIQVCEFVSQSGRNMLTELIDSGSAPLARPRLLRKRFPNESLASVISREIISQNSPCVIFRKSVHQDFDQQSKYLTRNTSLTTLALHAVSEINTGIQNGQQERAIDIAKTYRIVCPITSAIVLETKRQYIESGIAESSSPYLDIKPASVSFANPFTTSLSKLSEAAATAGGSSQYQYSGGGYTGQGYNNNGSSFVLQDKEKKAHQ